MASTSNNTTDLFSYCLLCKINHTQKRKHLFTNKHKQKLKIILKKFGAKVKLCKPYLENPLIQEGEFEPGVDFWCYFCYKAFKKHVTDRQKSIINGGLLEHLANADHWKATETFWLDNGIEQKFKTSFIISETDFDLYKEKVVCLVDKYESKAEERTKKIGEEIKLNENSRLFTNFAPQEESSSQSRILYRTVRNQHGILQNPTGYHDGVRVWRGGIIKYKHGSDQILPSRFHSKPGLSIHTPNHKKQSLIYTIAAESEGLSTVTVNKLDRSTHGNIHTGATPPWLRNDEEEPDKLKQTAGPSIEDFHKHRKRLEKNKLNPNRVGANFDHSADQGDNDWLPSFGRVWNDQARWKSRKEYRNEVEATEIKKKRKY